MKYAVCICAYNEHKMIEACLKQIPEWIGKIIVLGSKFPWHGMQSDTAHLTWDLLKKNKDARLEVHMHDWSSEQDQRNWGLGRASDCDWVFILDPDEFLTPEDWHKLYDEVPEVHLGSPCIVASSMTTYWKTWDYVWEPKDFHKPVIAVNPRQAVFIDKRGVSGGANYEVGVELHHLSWVKTNQEVWQKIQNYSHSNDFDHEDWFHSVWKPWSEENNELPLKPYGYSGVTRAVKRPLPDSIKAYFKDNPVVE